MKDRLAKLIKDKGLTLSKLADMLGIQPSGISHILSGRNNPGYDFICKILAAFPELSADWLLLGKGGMYSGVISAKGAALSRNDVIGQTETHQPIADVISNAAIAESAALLFPNTVAIEESVTAPSGASNNTVLNSASNNAESIEPNPATRSIKRVIIFYTDKTCEEYNLM